MTLRGSLPVFGDRGCDPGETILVWANATQPLRIDSIAFLVPGVELLSVSIGMEVSGFVTDPGTGSYMLDRPLNANVGAQVMLRVRNAGLARSIVHGEVSGTVAP